MRRSMKGQERNEGEVSQGLADFAARLGAARATERETDGKRETVSGIGLAWRVSLELVAAVAVGGGLGWLLDRGLGTRPWIMFLFLFLGGAAGVVSTYRITRGLDEAVGFGQAMRRQQERQKQRDGVPDTRGVSKPQRLNGKRNDTDERGHVWHAKLPEEPEAARE